MITLGSPDHLLSHVFFFLYKEKSTGQPLKGFKLSTSQKQVGGSAHSKRSIQLFFFICSFLQRLYSSLAVSCEFLSEGKCDLQGWGFFP